MYFSFPKQKEKYQKKVLFVPRMIQSLNQHAAARVLARRISPFEIIIQRDLVIHYQLPTKSPIFTRTFPKCRCKQYQYRKNFKAAQKHKHARK